MGTDYTQNYFDNQGAKISTSQENQNCLEKAPMGRPIKVTPEPGTQASRLKQLREAMGYQTQKAFAEFLGISSKLYNMYERGTPVSRLNAILIAKKCRVPVGWIHDGEEGDLSKGMLIRLGLMPPEAEG
jgi:DNA-binding XRE family transcriptional regulator